VSCSRFIGNIRLFNGIKDDNSSSTELRRDTTKACSLWLHIIEGRVQVLAIRLGFLVQEVALSQGFLRIFGFPITGAIPSMLRIHSSIVLGLTICSLEATAPQRHSLSPEREEKSFRRRKTLSLIVVYCGFEQGLRFLVMTDAKVPSKFMTTRTLASIHGQVSVFAFKYCLWMLCKRSKKIVFCNYKLTSYLFIFHIYKYIYMGFISRSQWQCSIRRGSVCARLLRLRVRIPPVA
jgi:hypothetical protein